MQLYANISCAKIGCMNPKKNMEMDRIEKLLAYLETSAGDSFLQHALALEYIKIGKDEEAENLFREILKREPGYVGSYYHLGKLQERKEAYEAAIATYEAGMKQAKLVADNHAYNELLMAKEEIEE